VNKSRSHRRTLRVLPRRKVVSSPPVFSSLTNAAAAESAADFATRQLIPDLPEQRTLRLRVPTWNFAPGRRRPWQRRHNCGGNNQQCGNACTHGDATRIDIELHFEPNLLLRVKDNGKGISPSLASQGRDGHFGLCGMRERASRIGAKFSLDTSPGRGTVVTLCVPKATAFETRGFEDSTEMDTVRLMLRRLKEFVGLS
jgi:hypothetical protein